MKRKLLKVTLIFSLTASAVYSQRDQIPSVEQAVSGPTRHWNMNSTNSKSRGRITQLGKFKVYSAFRYESATGQEVDVSGGDLVINLKPCDERSSHYMSFHQPYDKEPAGEVKCPDGKTIKLVSVTQK